MKPLAKIKCLIHRLRHRAKVTHTDAWDEVVRKLPPGQADVTSQSIDAYDDRRVPRAPGATRPPTLRIVRSEASQAALALLFELSLEQAIDVLRALPDTEPNSVSLEIEQRAFLRIRSHLEQQHFVQQPVSCLPILNLLAHRLSYLHDPAQRNLAMEMIAHSLRTVPQIELIESLTTELASMPPTLQQRALDQIEAFIDRTADIALSHVDILLGLTQAVRVEACRERASALITAGLKRLRDEPELCGKIRRSLVLAYCAADQNLQLHV